MAGRVLAVQKIDLIGFLFLLFILTWIPIHILTLAMLPKNIKGYKDAGVPMWPVVSSMEETMRVIAGSAFLNMVILFSIACILLTLHRICLVFENEIKQPEIVATVGFFESLRAAIQHHRADYRCL